MRLPDGKKDPTPHPVSRKKHKTQRLFLRPQRDGNLEVLDSRGHLLGIVPELFTDSSKKTPGASES
jgi:hypothetical protein